jgi:hypothetical protein
MREAWQSKTQTTSKKIKTGLFASLTLRAALRAFKALRALVPPARE